MKLLNKIKNTGIALGVSALVGGETEAWQPSSRPPGGTNEFEVFELYWSPPAQLEGFMRNNPGGVNPEYLQHLKTLGKSTTNYLEFSVWTHKVEGTNAVDYNLVEITERTNPNIYVNGITNYCYLVVPVIRNIYQGVDPKRVGTNINNVFPHVVIYPYFLANPLNDQHAYQTIFFPANENVLNKPRNLKILEDSSINLKMNPMREPYRVYDYPDDPNHFFNTVLNSL